MTSRTLETESTITTTTTTSESSVSILELAGTRELLPSPPNLKTESASWHSQWPTSRTTPLTASANSAPAMLSGRSHFETGSYQVSGPEHLNILDQFVKDNTPMSAEDYDYDTPMPRSMFPSIPDTHMLFTMDNENNNNTDDELEDFVLIGRSYEPISPLLSPSDLFPQL